MSVISSILFQHEPWKYSTLPEDQRCCGINAKTFGLNDPASKTTITKPRVVENSVNETANFSNPDKFTVHCFHIGEFTNAIPKRDSTGAFINRPSQCDELLYSDNRNCIILAEIKVINRRGTKIKQLKKTLKCLLLISDAKEFFQTFTSKKCCFFRKIPSSNGMAPTLASSVAKHNRTPNRLEPHHHITNPSKGIQITGPQAKCFEKYGFELWHFSDGSACTLI